MRNDYLGGAIDHDRYSGYQDETMWALDNPADYARFHGHEKAASGLQERTKHRPRREAYCLACARHINDYRFRSWLPRSLAFCRCGWMEPAGLIEHPASAQSGPEPNKEENHG